MVYTMFAKDEPNVAHNKNCVMKKASAVFGWTMQDCDQVKPFFCQLSEYYFEVVDQHLTGFGTKLLN